jgi:hypothetical protein
VLRHGAQQEARHEGRAPGDRQDTLSFFLVLCAVIVLIVPFFPSSAVLLVDFSLPGACALLCSSSSYLYDHFSPVQFLKGIGCTCLCISDVDGSIQKNKTDVVLLLF